MLIVLLSGTSIGCVTLGRHKALEARVVALEKWGDETRAQLKRDVGRLENLNTRIKSASAELRKYGAGLAAQVGGVEEQQRHFRGRVEEIEHTSQQLSDDLVVVRRFLDRKFGVSFVKLPKDLPKAPRKMFEVATQQMAAKKYDVARAIFQHFVRENPANALVLEAQLAIGETYRAQRRYKDALKVFFKVYEPWEGRETKAPRQVPTALWLAGQALIDSGACAKAMGMYKMLARYFRNAPEAVKAKAWQKEHKCN